MFKGLVRFGEITNRRIERYLIYQGEFEQRFENFGVAVPYRKFLEQTVSQLD